jgi:hypothetical protein
VGEKVEGREAINRVFTEKGRRWGRMGKEREMREWG